MQPHAGPFRPTFPNEPIAPPKPFHPNLFHPPNEATVALSLPPRAVPKRTQSFAGFSPCRIGPPSPRRVSQTNPLFASYSPDLPWPLPPSR